MTRGAAPIGVRGRRAAPGGPPIPGGRERTETVRVCLLAPEFLPVRGGVGTYSVALAREIAREVDLTVLTLTRREGSEIYGRPEMEAAIGHAARVLPLAEARDTFLYNARFQAELLRRLPGMARSERFDVVHSQHAHMPDLLAGPLIDSVPVVRTVHSTIAGQREAIRILESMGQSPDVTERWQIALAPALRAAERSTLRRPGPIFPVCRFAADHLAALGVARERIRVIPNGVDSDRFAPNGTAGGSDGPDEEGGPNVLFVGRFTMAKGVGTLVAAAPEVLRAEPRVRFRCTGKLPPRVAEWLNIGAGLLERFDFLGFVPDARLPSILARASVVVVPSLYDWLPFSVLEAMAAGRPIVASRVGGIPEMIRDGEDGLLVEAGAPHALAEAIVTLLRDEALRRRLGKHARERARSEFSWARTARSTVDGYRDAIRAFGGG